MTNQNRKHKKHDQAHIHHAPVLIQPEETIEHVSETAPVHKNRKWPLLLTGVLAIIVGSGYMFENVYGDKFYPGESIGGFSVAGKTLDDVISIFNDKAKILTDNGLQLTLSNGSTTKQVSVPMFAQGLSSDNSFEYFSLGDWKKTIQASFAFGHTGSIWHRMAEQILLAYGKNIRLPGTVYEGSMNEYLSYELGSFLNKSQPAQFALNKKGQVYIVPEKIGNDIYIEEVISELKDKLASYDSKPLALKAEVDVPLSTENKLQPYLQLAQQFSKKVNIIFSYRDHTWKVSGAKFVTWLTIKKNNDIGVDSDKLTNYLSKTVGQVINDPPQNSRFEMQNGKLVETFTGHPGSVVDVLKTAQRVEDIIPKAVAAYKANNNFAAVLDAPTANFDYEVKSGNINVPIDVSQEQPTVTKETVDMYNITELVGSAKTSFLGSGDSRIHNIALGISQFNGTFLAPGQEFSAVNAIGFVTEDKGYVKEYVIKDNKSVKELGGGLCQVGTTLFRLALSAGLPITERVPHRYVIKYYGPGLDATAS